MPMLSCTTDASDSDQDAHIAGFILEAGRALVVWLPDEYQRDTIKQLTRKLALRNFAQLYYISHCNLRFKQSVAVD